jgi:hypothetical protein
MARLRAKLYISVMVVLSMEEQSALRFFWPDRQAISASFQVKLPMKNRCSLLCPISTWSSIGNRVTAIKHSIIWLLDGLLILKLTIISSLL